METNSMIATGYFRHRDINFIIVAYTLNKAKQGHFIAVQEYFGVEDWSLESEIRSLRYYYNPEYEFGTYIQMKKLPKWAKFGESRLSFFEFRNKIEYIFSALF
jgi:hypothetical protein